MGPYQNLFNLITNNAQAHEFFSALPVEVQKAVSYQADDLQSLDSLEQCAQEFLSDYD